MTGTDRTRLQEVSLGMVVLGLIFSSMLYGVMLTQTYKYYQRFRSRDPLAIKSLVFAVWLLNTGSMFLVGHGSWYYLVTNGSRYVSIWSLNSELALSVVISAISESFLAFRVYRVSGRKRWLTAILLFFALTHFVSGQVAAIESLLFKRSGRLNSVMVPSVLRLGSAAICDTAIAASLSYFLHTKRTGFKQNDEIIDALILFSINSGLATSLISIASLITFLTVPKLWVYTALCFLISRLYSNTFLCTLNSRQALRTQLAKEKESLDVSAVSPTFRPRRRGTWSTSGRPRSDEKLPTQIDVFVVTETISDVLQAPEVAMIRNSNIDLMKCSERASTSTTSSQ